MTLNDMCKNLREPFPADVIGWKVQSVSKDETRCMVVPYIDARDVMDRLDVTIGPSNWQTRYTLLHDGSIQCEIGLFDAERNSWIWKGDVGGEATFGATSGGDKKPNPSNNSGNRTKGAYSDALKRAAVHWGIARYLYKLPHYWREYDRQKRQAKENPRLPDWALPATDKQQPRQQPQQPKAPAQPTQQQKAAPTQQAQHPETMTPEQYAELIELIDRWRLLRLQHPETMTPEQYAELIELIPLAKADVPKLKEHYRVKDLAQLTREQFADCMEKLHKKRSQYLATPLKAEPSNEDIYNGVTV